MHFIAPITVIVAFRTQPKILNGNAASLGEFPFFALLSFPVDAESALVCGGALISHEFILTAGHCTVGSGRVKVVLGYFKKDDQSETQHFEVPRENFFVHSSFTLDKMTNDIALIRLPEKAKLTPSIKPIQLSVCGFSKFIDVIAIGCGSTVPNTYKMAPNLQYAHLKTISMEICKKCYPFLNEECDLICAWSLKNSSIYRGDSGSPLVKRDDGTLFGISNFGNQNDVERNIPQAFTFLSCHFDWISKITGLQLPKQSTKICNI